MLAVILSLAEWEYRTLIGGLFGITLVLIGIVYKIIMKTITDIQENCAKRKDECGDVFNKQSTDIVAAATSLASVTTDIANIKVNVEHIRKDLRDFVAVGNKVLERFNNCNDEKNGGSA